MSIIVTYDVSAEWYQVKHEAFKLGFYNIVKSTGGDLVLPNTTLFIDGVTRERAVQLFLSAIEKARTSAGEPIRLEKMMAGEISDWYGISDRSG